MPVNRRPKPEGQKRNRMPVLEFTEIANVPFRGAPKLPGYADYSPATRRWWRVISSMPHCVLWSESDWQFAIDTARIAADLHAGKTTVAAEVRRRERILGNTFDARRDLRIRYVDDAASIMSDEESAAVTAMDGYRRAAGD